MFLGRLLPFCCCGRFPCVHHRLGNHQVSHLFLIHISSFFSDISAWSSDVSSWFLDPLDPQINLFDPQVYLRNLQIYPLPSLLHRHCWKAEVVDLPKSYWRRWLLWELLADVRVQFQLFSKLTFTAFQVCLHIRQAEEGERQWWWRELRWGRWRWKGWVTISN